MSELKKIVSIVKNENKTGALFYLSPVLEKDNDSDYPAAISLETKQLFFELEQKSTTTTLSNEQTNEMKILFGMEVDPYLQNMLINDNEHSKEKEIYLRLKKLSKRSEYETRTYWQKLFFEWFEFEPKHFVEETDIKGLVQKIMVYSNLLAVRSRMGAADFVIVNSRIGSMISDSPAFSFFPINPNINSNGLSYAIGSLGGRIKVIINPNLRFSDETIILGRNNQQGNEGLYLVENSPVIEKIQTPTIGSNKLVLTEWSKLIETPRAYMNYYQLRITDQKHNLFTFLWNKLVNKIKIK